MPGQDQGRHVAELGQGDRCGLYRYPYCAEPLLELRAMPRSLVNGHRTRVAWPGRRRTGRVAGELVCEGAQRAGILAVPRPNRASEMLALEWPLVRRRRARSTSPTIDRGFDPWPDPASLHPRPLHRDLGDGQPKLRASASISTSNAMRSVTEQWKNKLGRRGPEGLEAALGVVERDAGHGIDEVVEGAVHRPIGEARGGPLRRPKPPGSRWPGRPVDSGAMNCGVCVGVDGHVGVGEGDDRRRGHGDAGPHGRPLAPILGQPDDHRVGERRQRGDAATADV